MRLFSSTFRAAAAASLFCLAAGAAQAQDRHVVIVNNTGLTMMEFYGSNTGSGSWEEDILGADTLPSGGQVRIDFDDASGYCMFDFRAVFEGGTVAERSNIDVCETSTYTYE